MPSALVGSIALQFARDKLTIGSTDIRAQLSAVVLDGERLWLACDEGCRIERLVPTGSPMTFAGHDAFPLDDLLKLPAPPSEEADIEGLAVDDGFLWVVGSHSVKRKKPNGESPSEVDKKLKETGRDGNRHLLARIPIVGNGLEKKEGGRRAAALESSTSSSALLDAIRSTKDPHLSPFLDLPGKDNGFDIEGLAVKGTRVWLGLRGPVLREWCCILELRIDAGDQRLRLEPADDGKLYRKHFLKLNGLGLRDLAIAGDDLLMLTGPTMAHEAPSEIWRWKNGARKGASVATADLERLLTLSQGGAHDRPEGLTVFEHGASQTSVLVVFDAPSDARKPPATTTVLADVYRLSH